MSSHVAAAAWCGDLRRVRELVETRVADKSACELAASGGHAHVLAWLLDEGVPAGNAVAYAVKAGSVPCLNVLYERGCPLTEAALKWAGDIDASLDVMTWVSERVIAVEVWARALQTTLDAHAQNIPDQAYVELSNMIMQCHRLSTRVHSC